MRWKQNIQWLVIFICCMPSCTRIIEVTPPNNAPKLVLHAYVQTGEKFHVSINQTLQANSVMDGNDTYVTDAWVLLYEENIFVDSLKYDAQTRRYRSQNVVAKPGKIYKVVAGAGGFTTVEASARASTPVNAVSVIHNKGARSSSNGELLDDVLFSFNDAENEKNFYLAALYSGEYTRGSLACVYSNDPAVDRFRGEVLPFEEGACFDNEQILFSDKSFNGKLKQVSISASSWYLEAAADSNGNLHRPYLKHSVISEDHYKYLKTTLSLYAGGVIPTMNEPVAVKGNVKNGYGLLAVYSLTTDTLR